MPTITQLILDKIDHRAIGEELSFLREKDAELDAIKGDVKEAKKDVSFWDRVNVFTSTEGEQELKEQKRALKESRRDHTTIINNIKSLIRESINLNPPVKLKMYLGELANDVDRLRIRQVRRHSNTTGISVNDFRIQGISEVDKGILRIDSLIAQEFGIEPGKLDESAVVGMVYDEILRSAGFIN